MKTNYLISADWFNDAEIALQVDFDVLTPELAAQINNFWSGAQDRLQYENGDVVRTVVRMFGQVAIRFFMEEGGAHFGPRTEGDRDSTSDVLKSQVEGWPDIDSLGILIMMADVSVVGYEDVTLEALTL